MWWDVEDPNHHPCHLHCRGLRQQGANLRRMADKGNWAWCWSDRHRRRTAVRPLWIGQVADGWLSAHDRLTIQGQSKSWADQETQDIHPGSWVTSNAPFFTSFNRIVIFWELSPKRAKASPLIADRSAFSFNLLQVITTSDEACKSLRSSCCCVSSRITE